MSDSIWKKDLSFKRKPKPESDPDFELSEPKTEKQSLLKRTLIAHQINILSDRLRRLLEQEIVQLAASGLFEEALDQAERWSKLRPDRMKPKSALLRVQHAAGAGDREHVRRVMAAAVGDSRRPVVQVRRPDRLVIANRCPHGTENVTVIVSS